MKEIAALSFWRFYLYVNPIGQTMSEIIRDRSKSQWVSSTPPSPIANYKSFYWSFNC